MNKKGMVMLAVTLGLFCAGCASEPVEEGSAVKEENTDTEVQMGEAGTEDNFESEAENSTLEAEDTPDEIPRICRLTQADVAVTPEVVEYSFEDASQSGTVQEMFGILPGAAEGTWYTVEIDGIEYYYGRLSGDEPEGTKSYGYGWSIISSEYVLANGLKTGMSESQAAEICPNMAVMDFEHNFVGESVTGTQGWNGIAYPHRNAWQEGGGEYAGMDYSWTDQFDYVMIADIILPDEPYTLPLHLALLIKDHTVMAITFYYPTAG